MPDPERCECEHSKRDHIAGHGCIRARIDIGDQCCGPECECNTFQPAPTARACGHWCHGCRAGGRNAGRPSLHVCGAREIERHPFRPRAR